MKRRAATATTETLPGLDPAYLAARAKLAAGETAGRPLPKRQYGRTTEELSIAVTWHIEWMESFRQSEKRDDLPGRQRAARQGSRGGRVGHCLQDQRHPPLACNAWLAVTWWRSKHFCHWNAIKGDAAR
jgi:hypothetical protein